jgi:uncharacterized protein
MNRIYDTSAVFIMFVIFNSCNLMTVKNSPEFSQALVSDHPAVELGTDALLYSWLIGGWEVKAMDYLSDSSILETHGEWYFSWVLEGRAVQDVWIAPKRELRNPEMSKVRNRYGSTIRMFDVNRKKWRINWFNPVTGAQDELWEEKVGEEIIHTGTDSDGNGMKWVFTDIQADSFRWYAVRTFDSGLTWHKEAEFWGKKMEMEEPR